MVDFVHNNKDLYGVEAICRVLPIAPSTYYRTLDLADEKHCFAREHRAKRDLHISIMLNKLNESGRKVQVDMVYVKSGKS